MSGSFTQRGDVCILDKFTRAQHAVLGGADAVIELPAPFSVATAEIFASGAIKILSSIPDVQCLAFGCENKVDFVSVAKTLLNEDERFKSVLAEKLKSGESYIKSYAQAYSVCGGKVEILSTPNNILAIEYAKAILRCRKDITLLPIERVGGGYLSEELQKNYSSASAIRANLAKSDISANVPPFVYEQLKNVHYSQSDVENILKYALISSSKEQLKGIMGCTEGLENKLKELEGLPLEQIIAKASGKRYSSSRIRRILTCNALGIYERDCREFLQSDLYIKPLAVKSDKKDDILNALGKSNYPITIKGRDVNNLSDIAKRCFEKDVFALKIWDLIFKKQTYNYTLYII
jgi:predicted nucleotidyltransferase